MATWLFPFAPSVALSVQLVYVLGLLAVCLPVCLLHELAVYV